MSDDILQQALKDFESAEENFSDNHERYEDDVKFSRLGEQWDEGDVESRRKEGRPTLTINRMPAFIRQVVNDARQNKPSIKVHPVDDKADPAVAEVINGLIRNIENVSKADLAYDTAIDCAVTGGFGYFRVGMEYADCDTFDMDITIDRILNPLTVYPDPASTAADSSDWRFCFVTEMITVEEFKEKYPGKDVTDWKGQGSDKSLRSWSDGDRMRIAEYWVREENESQVHLLTSGEIIRDDIYQEYKEYYDSTGIEIEESRDIVDYSITQHIMSGSEVLETNPFPGKYIPIVPVYGDEVFIDGKRDFFSLVHFAKDPQRIYNYWRTTTTELVALAPKAPWIGEEGAFDVDGRWDDANTKSYPYLEYKADKQPPQRQPFAGPPAGALQEALNASDDMKSVMGMHDASMGAQSNEISGVAIGKRVRESDTSTFHFIDNMSRAIRHAGNIIIGLIPHVYSRARMVRILGEDGAPQTVAINQPIQHEMQSLQDSGIDRMEAINNVYDLTVGKYDVTVKEGPSYTTQREEARESMISLVRAFPAAAQVTGDLIADSMDWPNADKFAKRLKSLLPPELRDDSTSPEVLKLQQQLMQMQEQMQQQTDVINQLAAGERAKMAAVDVDRQRLALDAQKVQIELMRAETERMKAQSEAMQADKNRRTDVIMKGMDIEAANMRHSKDNAINIGKLSLGEEEIEIKEDLADLKKMEFAEKVAANTGADAVIIANQSED